ncbi:MAG: response regulator transcription factor [Dehalococcoidia bacterium]
MSDLRDRLQLIHNVAQLLRQKGETFDAQEREFAVTAIEREAELALADLECATPRACPDPQCSLSAREIEVLSLVSNGLPDKQIARLLGISTFTVNKHVGAILMKMQASSRTEAGVRAITEGFVQPRAS